MSVFTLLLVISLSALVLGSGNNVLQIGTTPFKFNYSTVVNTERTNTPFKLYWNISPDAKNITFGVQANPGTDSGWVSIGFNAKGNMYPSRSIVALLPSGATTTTVAEFELTGVSASSVTPATTPVISNAVGAYANGVMSFVFTIPAAADPNIAISPGTTQRTGLIYAIGPRPTSVSQFSIHTDTGAMSVALAESLSSTNNNAATMAPVPPSAVATGITGASTDGFTLSPDMQDAMIAFHATCMFLTWLVIIPLACLFASPIIRARLFSGDIYANPRYTLAHKIGVGFASIVMIIGYSTGYFLIDSGDAPTHFYLGTVVAILVMLQSALGAWRSSIQTKIKGNISSSLDGKQGHVKLVFGASHKNTIATIHAWTGRLVWLMAVANIFVGFDIAGYPYYWQIITAITLVSATVPMLYGPVMSYLRR